MRTHLLTFATAALFVCAAVSARGQDCGDCDRDGEVEINELISAVSNALGAEPRVSTVCESLFRTCEDALGACDDDLDQCKGDRDACYLDLTACQTDRASIRAELNECTATLTQCEKDRDACCSQCDGTPLLPATGQTTCWNVSGGEIDCLGTGQDGEIRAGALLAYRDNGDGTITDLNTQLMWEKKDDGGGVHDKDNTYTWDAAFAFSRGLNAGTGFAGYTDWRLPNIKELESILDYENSRPMVSPTFHMACAAGCTVTNCSCTQSTNTSYAYWSSTTVQYSPSNVWFVDFHEGGVRMAAKSGGHYARAVRGGL